MPAKLLTATVIAALVLWMIIADTPALAEDPGNCEVAYSPEIGRCETPDSPPRRARTPQPDPDRPDPEQPDPEQPDPEQLDPEQPAEEDEAGISELDEAGISEPDPNSGQRRQGWATATIRQPLEIAEIERDEEGRSIASRELNPQNDPVTPQRIAAALELPLDRPIWEWNAQYQRWIQHAADSSDVLAAGTTIAYKDGLVSQQAQTLAGIGPTDQTVRLHNGWNILTASSTGFLLDNSLIDCSENQGAIALLRYDHQTGATTANLPCYPQQRPLNMEPITQINPGDTIYIYYRTILPVTVRYDSEQHKYQP